ncbi:MAG TPA: cupin domain-containing protein [bacterium]|nr:cupin domain-containing protein [bacterium]
MIKSSSSGLAAGRVVTLAALIDYQTDAIVSRTLINKDKGTVTLFAFDAGQSLSEHTAPFDALVQVLDGSLELTVGGATVTATAGEVVLLPAEVPHALRAEQAGKMLLTMIRA